jgi:hypothetical protein
MRLAPGLHKVRLEETPIPDKDTPLKTLLLDPIQTISPVDPVAEEDNYAAEVLKIVEHVDESPKANFLQLGISARLRATAKATVKVEIEAKASIEPGKPNTDRLSGGSDKIKIRMPLDNDIWSYNLGLVFYLCLSSGLRTLSKAHNARALF